MALIEAILDPERQDKFLVGLYACFQQVGIIGRPHSSSAVLKSSTMSHTMFRT